VTPPSVPPVLPTLHSDSWTTTGLFALPGKPTQVTRLDNNGSDVLTDLYFWFQVRDWVVLGSVRW
jgi:hypothetical protein